MVIVIANDLPPAVRGRMKLWFIEPRANVFVSGIKDSVADSVVDYLFKHCPPKSGIMIFKSISQTPGFAICGFGDTKRSLTTLSGFPLVEEKNLHDKPGFQKVNEMWAN